MGKLRGNLKQTWHDPIHTLKAEAPVSPGSVRETGKMWLTNIQSIRTRWCLYLPVNSESPFLLFPFTQVASLHSFWEICLWIKLRVGARLLFKTHSFNWPPLNASGRILSTKGQPFCTCKGWRGWSCHSDCTFITCRSSAEQAVSGQRALHCSQWFMIKTHSWRLINWLWHSKPRCQTQSPPGWHWQFGVPSNGHEL